MLIAKFADNNTVLSTTKMTPFFANKGFHPRISFSPDTTKYEIIRERLLVARAEDITRTIKNVLDFITQNAKES